MISGNNISNRDCDLVLMSYNIIKMCTLMDGVDNETLTQTRPTILLKRFVTDYKWP